MASSLPQIRGRTGNAKAHAPSTTAKAWRQIERSLPLARDFFARPAAEVARELLGKALVHKLGGLTLAGKIVETEAYVGTGDLAAHAARGLTPRTQVLFGPPGHAYVYFIYGMYECLNFVCEQEGTAGCVLIRALEPVAGIEEMKRRRPAARRLRDLTSGPGKLTLAMGITRQHYGCDLTQSALQVREFESPGPSEILVGKRIGISVSQDLPLRFYIKDNEFVSR
jgi:DNA-3-methyladenine glycosylase